MIDLHTHSSASDGVLSPTELVHYARNAEIEVLALTDHDTLSGLAEALDEAEKVGLPFIPGVEISAEYSPGTMHVLGYFIDPAGSGLEDSLIWLREGRDARNLVILRKLSELGLPLDYDEVASLAKGESMGRPHIARAMVSHGYAASFEDAFERFLGKGAPAYAERPRMTPDASITHIRRAGGLPVLAHPQTLGLGDGQLADLVRELKLYGLAGIEVYYYEHSTRETKLYETLARENGLLMTGGSDFHGPGMLGSELGKGRGGLNVPRILADALFEAHRAAGR